MNTSITPDSARHSIARELSRYYHREAAGNQLRFDFGRAIGAMCSERGLQDGLEGEVAAGAAMSVGRQHDPHRVLIPFSAFKRDLAATVGTGAYLVSSDTQRPVDVLRGSSVTKRAGVTTLDGLVGHLAIPRVVAAATASWNSTEGQSITPSEPTTGEAVASPKKHAAGFMRFSRQLAKQAAHFGRFVETQVGSKPLARCSTKRSSRAPASVNRPAS